MQLPDRIKVLNTHNVCELIIMPDTVTHVTVSYISVAGFRINKTDNVGITYHLGAFVKQLLQCTSNKCYLF